MDTNCRSRVQNEKKERKFTQRERQKDRKDKKRMAHFPAGEGQKDHAGLNGFPDSERHGEAG